MSLIILLALLASFDAAMRYCEYLGGIAEEDQVEATEDLARYDWSTTGCDEYVGGI